MTPSRYFELLSDSGVPAIVSSLLAGFAALDWWGKPYLTAAGEAYLAGLA